MRFLKGFFKHKQPFLDIQYAILHNRKTAGSVLKYILEEQKRRTPDMKVAFFGHATHFPGFLKKNTHAKVIFFIRDPISRFISGFNSRLRQGAPLYHFPWSSREKKAFARFKTPNELAEALSSTHFFERRAAIFAMKSIAHVRHTYRHFLGELSFLKKHVNRIAFIGHQPEFNTHLEELKQLLKIDSDIHAPEDDFRSHRNPSHLQTELSPVAMANLKRWYKKDFEIYRWCLEQRPSLNPHH